MSGITPKKENDMETSPSPARGGPGGEGRRWQLYIGNLTWWPPSKKRRSSAKNLPASAF